MGPRCRYRIGQTATPLKVVPIHFGAPTTAPTFTAAQENALSAQLAARFAAPTTPAVVTVPSSAPGGWAGLSTGGKVAVASLGVLVVTVGVLALRKKKR